MSNVDYREGQTVTVDEDGVVVGEAQSQGEVALYPKTRFPFDPVVETKYNVDWDRWRTLLDTIFPSAKTAAAVVMALDYCKARELDIFKRPVHIVPMWSSVLGREIETVWPAISELRTTAFRTGQYGGLDEPEFGPMIRKEFKPSKGPNFTVEFPEWCRITVYRVLNGTACKFVGPKVVWDEAYATQGRYSEAPNHIWAGRPIGQIEKCAEAAALRRAFPEEIGNDLSAEEMEGRVLGSIDSIKLRHDEGEAPINALAVREARPEPRKRPAKKKNGHDGEADQAAIDAKVAAELEKLGHAHKEPAPAAAPVAEAKPVPGPKAGEQTQYMQPNPNDPEPPLEDERPFDDLPADDLPVEEEPPFDAPVTTERDVFRAALEACSTLANAIECGKAWRDRRQVLVQSKDKRDQDMAQGMLDDYKARRDVLDKAEKAASQQTIQEAGVAPDPRPTDSPASTPTATSEAPGGKGDDVNPGWSQDLEDIIASVGNPEVRKFAIYIWGASGAKAAQDRYLEITATPRYHALKTSAERIALAKTNTAAQSRK